MAVSILKFNVFLEYLSKYIQVRPEEALAIAGILQIGSFKKNSLLMEEGKVSDMLGLILKGYARTYYYDHQNLDSTKAFIWESDIIISPSSFFGRKPAGCSVVAMEQVELLYAHYDDLMPFLEKNPRFEGVVKDLVRDLIPDVSNHTKLLQMTSARDRYEHFIATRPDVIKRVPQKHIASYLGMTTETLSRIRGRMK
jgi:CRP/FNR family transcriptional regulator, anaerobic regulatory protein